MSAEEWRPVPGLPGYDVSSHGRVRSHRRGRPQALSTRIEARSGYVLVTVSRHLRKSPVFRVHRLVMLAFVGPCPEGLEVRHLDGNPQNNTLRNLRYGTSLENHLDVIAHGNHNNIKKTHCPARHPYDEANTYVDPGGRRACRTCRRATDLRRKARNRAARRLLTEAERAA